MDSYSKLFVFSACFLLLLPFPILLVNASSESGATLALTEAEEALVSAHEAVLEAEQAGANVSGLLNKLNHGAEYLAEAYVWYRLGVSENAGHFAGLCSDVVGGMSSEAVELRDDAKRLEEADFVVNMIGSVVGVIGVFVSCSIVWLVFRRRYRRRVLGLRPEVVSGES
jgi:hypothetical protein